ncbi:hypothetical protein QQY24_02465 [Streptomyces sp. TG1A-8]|uniref:hypothetical protein n=1 Tax=Streptomyces sp. TG1A-8 TaxID=3051385 RepID=UPI00265BDC49|nr:hypothetical protein [Streptomyces sp. TG1A-8]MDO0924327.1 hypothetical protein [Streptomyces sp. TG1A-8]
MTRPGPRGGTGEEPPATGPVIGLAVGRGTGPELAAVFERVLGALTAALHLPYDAVLRFMRVVYGARTTTADDPGAWAAPVPGQEPGPRGEPCAPSPG